MTEFRESPLPELMTAWRAAPPVLRGILMMCAASVLFSVMHVLVRYASRELPPFEIAFFRNLFGVVIFIPLLVSGGLGFLRTSRIGLHAVRGLLNVAAMLMFFTALSLTDVARVTALSFTAPLFMALMSVLFLGERFRIRRWLALALGFAGMLIVLRPGVIEADLGSLLVVGSALIWAVTMVVIKILSRTESSFAITAYMNIFLSVFSLVPALWVWVTPSAEMWVWLVAIGVSGTLAQLTLSQALKETEPTAVLPFDFLKLIWASLLGLWVFGELPDLYTYIGAAVIFASGFYIALREHRERRRAAALRPFGEGRAVENPLPDPPPSRERGAGGTAGDAPAPSRPAADSPGRADRPDKPDRSR
ncbi:MAG TPA: DMT family transporter [Thermohalobaculum sp.]|nr:DMT family transporter [Thermohalobaculum sp.]